MAVVSDDEVEEAIEAALPSISALLDAMAASRPDHLAVVADGITLSYAQLRDRSRDLAAHLVTAGARRGTVVGVLLPNGADWVCWWAACARLGAVVVPMNTFAAPVEVERVLRHCGAQIFVAVRSFASHEYHAALTGLVGAAPTDADLRSPALPQLRRITWVDEPLGTADVPGELLDELAADVTPADVLTIIYSSGTTGDPKGVVHAHGAVLRQAARLAAATGTDDACVLWTSMPLNWVGGLVWSFLRSVVCGGTFVTQARFDPPAALDLFRRTGVNTVTAWGPVLDQLLTDPGFDDQAHGAIVGLRRIEVGPDARPSALGMTETLGPHSGWFGDDDDVPDGAWGSLGRSLPGAQHRVVTPGTEDDVPDGTPGELLVRADSLMVGLHGRERRNVFTSDGWYRTGDGAVIRDGWLFFQGRIDDLIKTAGANVSPAEVQRALLEHPCVLQAFVVGIPDPKRGQTVVAFVVPGSGYDRAALLGELKGSLASYKVPRRVIELTEEEIPWMSSQKVDVKRLRQMATSA